MNIRDFLKRSASLFAAAIALCAIGYGGYLAETKFFSVVFPKLASNHLFAHTMLTVQTESLPLKFVLFQTLFTVLALGAFLAFIQDVEDYQYESSSDVVIDISMRIAGVIVLPFIGALACVAIFKVLAWATAILAISGVIRLMAGSPQMIKSGRISAP